MISRERWVAVPIPAVPQFSFPGFFLEYEMRSSKLLYGESFRTTIRTGEFAYLHKGMKSESLKRRSATIKGRMVKVVMDEARIVYPSGLALATYCAPTAPPPPPLLVNMADTPRDLESSSPIRRTARSKGPPAPKLIITSTGREGNSLAFPT